MVARTGGNRDLAKENGMNDPGVSAKTMVKAAVILAVIFLSALGAVKLADLWMLMCGSVVVAAVVRSIADPLVRRLKLPERVAVFLAIVILFLTIAGVVAILGQMVAAQARQLSTLLPVAWRLVQTRLEASPFSSEIVSQLKVLAAQAARSLVLAPAIAMSIASGATTLILVIVAGLFLAGHPKQAREGALSLAPLAARPRLREVMNACGQALKYWLRAQLVSMTLVGVLVALGLWAIGVPAALALGLLSGVAQLVPIVGPTASAIPALIVGASGGTDTVLLIIALFTAVSQLEANIITPLVQKNLASLPIVLGVFAVVGLGILFGPLGVLFATPLAITAYTAVTMLYRQDVLHDPEATAPGTD
jgi:predicted PurR-regulated permease PerM